MCSVEEMIAYKMLNILEYMQKPFEEKLQDVGLTTGNYVTMIHIHQHPGITQAELAKLKKKDRTVTGQTIDKLEEKGLVERVKLKSDRRCYTLYVTEEGEIILKKFWQDFKNSEESFLDILTAKEKESFNSLIEKLMNRGNNNNE